MRLLILGAGGKVGRLMKAGWPPDCPVTPIWHGRSTGAVQFDILREPDALKQAILDCECVFVLAGVTQDDVGRPFSTNSDIARAVLENAAGKPMFLVSSAAVYGRSSGCLSEDRTLSPVSDYGRSKQDMEGLAKGHPNATILRIGNIAGADALLGIPRDRYRLDQFPDGGFPVRSYIGPGLLAGTIASLARKVAKGEALPKVLNIACPRPVSMAELLDAAGLLWDAKPADETAIETVHLDTTKLWGASPPKCDAASIVADWRQTEARL